jgi:cysteine desulfurase
MGKTATYLDWAATAPLSAFAAEAMAEAAGLLASGAWANPSSQHGPGRAARRAIEEAREAIARFLRVPADALIFTSGGTEALFLGLRGVAATARFVMATEHPAVLEAAPEAVRLPVDEAGRLRLDALDTLPEGALVAVQQANSETGVVQDIAAIARLVHARGGELLVDCVQAAGKLPIPAAADYAAVSAHKLGGPAGVGVLVARCRERLSPVQRGGGQEGGFRGGTANLLGIIGFAAAVSAFDPAFPARAGELRRRIEERAVALGARINGAEATRIPTISSIHLPGVPAATQLMALDLAGVAVSQGSACSSGTLKASPVLEAMGWPEAARESLRVSLGWATGQEDVARFLAAWEPLARRRAA